MSDDGRSNKDAGLEREPGLARLVGILADVLPTVSNFKNNGPLSCYPIHRPVTYGLQVAEGLNDKPLWREWSKVDSTNPGASLYPSRQPSLKGLPLYPIACPYRLHQACVLRYRRHIQLCYARSEGLHCRHSRCPVKDSNSRHTEKDTSSL